VNIFFPVTLLVFLTSTQAESNTNTNLAEVVYAKMKHYQREVWISEFPEFLLVYFGTNALKCPFVTFIPPDLSLRRCQASQKTVQGVSHALS